MSKRAPKMRFFTDQNVPESVNRVLEDGGYEVVRLREKTAVNSPDTLVAAVSEANHAVLVTHDSDFKSVAQRQGIGRRRFRELSLLRFEGCRESNAAQRLSSALSLVEHEWKVGGGDRDRRMFVVVTAQSIRTHR